MDATVDAIQVVTTTNQQSEARKIAEALVERRLAACVQIMGPIESWYRWQGAIEAATEWRCVIKTRRSIYPAVERAIRELHSYDEPQIVALPIVSGSEGYLRWLLDETPPPPPSGPDPGPTLAQHDPN